jgi:hypothetical protein
MRPIRRMSAVERFFERLFERPSARLFGTRVQPVQLQRRIERAMEQGRVVEAGRSRVPDRFTVRLNRADLARLEAAAELPIALASGALDWARRHGHSLAARPRVAIVADVALRPGDIDVEARYSDTTTGPDVGLPVDLGQTRVFAAPVVRSPRATLAVRESDGGTRTIVADGGPLSIGRTADNTLVLDDSRVSRRHARLQARDGVLVLVDLDSTNGTRVNGSRIREVAVGAGDVIEIGDATIAVVAIEDGLGPDAARVDGTGTA